MSVAAAALRSVLVGASSHHSARPSYLCAPDGAKAEAHCHGVAPVLPAHAPRHTMLENSGCQSRDSTLAPMSPAADLDFASDSCSSTSFGFRSPGQSNIGSPGQSAFTTVCSTPLPTKQWIRERLAEAGVLRQLAARDPRPQCCTSWPTSRDPWTVPSGGAASPPDSMQGSPGPADRRRLAGFSHHVLQLGGDLGTAKPADAQDRGLDTGDGSTKKPQKGSGTDPATSTVLKQDAARSEAAEKQPTGDKAEVTVTAAAVLESEGVAAPSVAVPEDGATPSKKGSAPPKGKGKGKGAPPPPKKGGGRGKGKSKGAEPRKPEVVPKVPLKRLFWTPICIDPSPEAAGTVWAKLDADSGQPAFDTEALEALFASEAPPPAFSPTACKEDTESPVSPERKSIVERPRAERRRLFEEQRRRQVWCMLARMPERGRVLEAIIAMDDKVLRPDEVELLLGNLPCAEEEVRLQEAVSDLGPDGMETLDEPESFMLSVIGVPEYELRVRVWDFLNSFDGLAERLSSAEAEVSAAGMCLQHSVRLERLLALILQVGNYLNGGTSRGRADGFDLDTLAKLGKLKASPQSTLLDFIVAQFEREHPGLLQELFAPGAESECVHRARRHGMTDVRDEVRALLSKAQGYLARLEARRESADDALAWRQQQISQCVERLQELGKGLERWAEHYCSLCAWFHVDSQKGVASDEFFGIWDTFLTDVKKALDVFDRQHRAQRASRRGSSLPPMRRSSLPPRSEGAALETHAAFH